MSAGESRSDIGIVGKRGWSAEASRCVEKTKIKSSILPFFPTPPSIFHPGPLIEHSFSSSGANYQRCWPHARPDNRLKITPRDTGTLPPDSPLDPASRAQSRCICSVVPWKERMTPTIRESRRTFFFSCSRDRHEIAPPLRPGVRESGRLNRSEERLRRVWTEIIRGGSSPKNLFWIFFLDWRSLDPSSRSICRGNEVTWRTYVDSSGTKIRRRTLIKDELYLILRYVSLLF